MTLPEQVLAAELAYSRQSEQFSATAEDWATWEAGEGVRALLETRAGKLPMWYQPESFAHHLLKRRGYSLHRYMAKHLSLAAWAYWCEQGSLLAPF
jgi:hypothetical protein